MRVRERRPYAHGNRRVSPPGADTGGPRSVTALGLTFANRLGLAAGFDRTGELLPSLRTVGFGHVEVGTITPATGHASALGRSDLRMQIGANIGSARPGLDEGVIEDYTRTMKQVFGLCDYMDVVSAVRGRRLPLLLKLEGGLNGKSFPAAIMATRVHGLDGIVLVSDCLDRIRAISAYLGGLSIISVGGVRSADDVRARVAAGAALVQIHSAYANGGVARIRRILKELSPPSEPSFA